MKILKIVIFALIGLVAIVLIAAAVVKKEYAVERETAINKPVAEVFGYVKYLKNQDNYSKWANMANSYFEVLINFEKD